MSDSQTPTSAAFDGSLLAQLGTLDVAAALRLLEQQKLTTLITGLQLADAALARAEAEPRLATHWLLIAEQMNVLLGNAPHLSAQIEYSQARLAVQNGNVKVAEALLRSAQSRWQLLGDQAALTRSYLGLTQILTVQGRYVEAEQMIRQAIATLEAQPDAENAELRALRARVNLATLLSYQERHRQALDECSYIQQRLAALRTQMHEQQQALTLDELTAQVELTRATALAHLDEPTQAEAALQSALAIYQRLTEKAWASSVRVTLGGLYLRTGRYAAALGEFDRAAVDLFGDTAPADAAANVAVNQDNLLLLELERALAYLALNLLSEATTALERCEALYRRANQPYELGQALLALGTVYLRLQNYALAQRTLQEAEAIFTALQNSYWKNRTNLALATLFYQQNDVTQATQRLTGLPTAKQTQPAPAEAALDWDTSALIEGWLLQIRLQLTHGDIELARQTAALVSAALTADGDGSASAWPHFQVYLQHALGRIEWRAGNYAQAQVHLDRAISGVEAQRISLPLEETRTAFLNDKIEIYNDLLLVQLETPAVDQTTLATAFATIERARSRALLERLLTSVDPAADLTVDPQLVARREEVRQQLHWLYNQLLSESGSRRADATLNRAIQGLEAALQQLEWRTSPLLMQAQPVELAMLQAVLAADQQALLYYIAGDEVLAFIVRREYALVKRRLCSVRELQRLQAEFDFQMGRAELGSAYVARHRVRLQRALEGILLRLHHVLIAPLADELTLRQLLLIPYGSLHLLPFHALWDGSSYLLERYECTYAPSAGVAVHCRRLAAASGPFRSFAGLAVTDAAIPQARAEVEMAARYFPEASLYLDEVADQAGLTQALQTADVVHLATHGLFRPDNPFFSALKLADGWIDVRTIYRLPLVARLVVLSACQSGAGRVQGADEVIGLARGFLGAGAHTLLVSLWNVHDASAVRFMADFYQRLTTAASPRPAAALKAAQLAALRTGQHPYYWAPFLLIG
jgi:CHAT domain-containing protein